MMLNYDYLREALYEIFMLGLGGFLSFAFIVMLYDALKTSVKRLLHRVVRKLERSIIRAEKRREHRRVASVFVVENIPGTSGYRIKGR